MEGEGCNARGAPTVTDYGISASASESEGSGPYEMWGCGRRLALILSL